jgi:hypothetical protein
MENTILFKCEGREEENSMNLSECRSHWIKAKVEKEKKPLYYRLR